jgi:Na+-driven multidrug efflux pump
VVAYALITSLSIAALIYFTVFIKADQIIGMFNSEQNLNITRIANIGLRIYFLGFFFAGININMAMYLSATERTKEAFVISIARGCIIIVPMVLLLSNLLNMSGVWLAFVLTEGVVTIMMIIMSCSKKNKMISNYL